MATQRTTRKFFTLSQALEQVLEDDEDVQNVVLLPPDQDGCQTDEDENEGESVPRDVPGHVEVDVQVETEDPEEEHPLQGY
jgi:preprotein translocase subunit Sec63